MTARQFFAKEIRSLHPLWGLLNRAITLLNATLLCASSLFAQNPPNSVTQDPFPDADLLMSRVAQHQKEIESQLSQYTFTDTTTQYMLDKNGKARTQHTDTYYVTPTAWEFFDLHIAHDGKPLPESDLRKQEKDVERKIQEDEKKAQKPDVIHPKSSILFTDIILRSRFTPLRWDDAQGKHMLVYGFEPKATGKRGGELNDRIAGDMKGKMWISPEDAAIVRVEFTSVSALSLGMGFLGNIKGFDGFVEQRQMRGNVWLPSHQEFVAQGRQLIKGFRIRQVSDFTDYLRATTDVFQQVRPPKADVGGAPDAK
jgi:hypothetical protein